MLIFDLLVCGFFVSHCLSCWVDAKDKTKMRYSLTLMFMSVTIVIKQLATNQERDNAKNCIEREHKNYP
jgi:hypothetical protein